MQQEDSSENKYVIDAESNAEKIRLLALDELITRAMGGVISEQDFPERFSHILDVGCGPGGWALEAAFTYPDSQVVGVDISEQMIEYANTQAQMQNLQNVEFRVMDALKIHELPSNFFNLVNGRFLTGFLSRERWKLLIGELVRVATPGGIVRLTESDSPGMQTTDSTALNAYEGLLTQAFARAGMTLSTHGQHMGVTPLLVKFMRAAGLQDVTVKSHVLDYSVGSAAWSGQYRTAADTYRLVQPFIIKMGVSTQEKLDVLLEQALTDMMREDFSALWYFATVYGEKPAS